MFIERLDFARYSAVTDLREGDSFNSTFLRRSFLNLRVKKYENWSTFADVIEKIIIVVYFFLRLGTRVSIRVTELLTTTGAWSTL